MIIYLSSEKITAYHHPRNRYDSIDNCVITMFNGDDGKTSSMTFQDFTEGEEKFLHLLFDGNVSGFYVDTKTFEYAAEGTNEGRLMKIRKIVEENQ